ncbi:hypothetical protein P154DRAFT_540516 [Amniculicola lignicola CBS 123094]|uniref:Uncharacterized protein n=1 Tax=Amniculicola lignicola CBS 123094 TaxID=1392246 RepID=A0A6A5VWJ5_9PLEO|nr:hypothetical protein P154DRAFT_540516 [Amniculicola lignicola CBS 123094]
MKSTTHLFSLLATLASAIPCGFNAIPSDNDLSQSLNPRQLSGFCRVDCPSAMNACLIVCIPSSLHRAAASLTKSARIGAGIWCATRRSARPIVTILLVRLIMRIARRMTIRWSKGLGEWWSWYRLFAWDSTLSVMDGIVTGMENEEWF